AGRAPSNALLLLQLRGAGPRSPAPSRESRALDESALTVPRKRAAAPSRGASATSRFARRCMAGCGCLAPARRCGRRVGVQIRLCDERANGGTQLALDAVDRAVIDTGGAMEQRQAVDQADHQQRALLRALTAELRRRGEDVARDDLDPALVEPAHHRGDLRIVR